MAKITDVSSADTRLDAALNRLKKVDILERDKHDIEDFYFSMRRANLKKLSQIGYLNILTKACEYIKQLGIEKPLRDIDLRDYDKFIYFLEVDLNRTDWTLNQYKKSFRKFMVWAHGNNVPSWVKTEIKFKKVSTRIQPSDLPTQEECNYIINSAPTIRDKAILAVLANTGIRIGALLSCRVSSFVPRNNAAILYLEPDGQLKTTTNKGVPLTWSTGYVEAWLSNHPLRDESKTPHLDPRSPLWVTNIKVRVNRKDKTSKLEYQALSYATCYKMILLLGRKLGLNKNIFPHLFRHYAVTKFIGQGLSEQVIKYWAGWGPDSKELGRYGNWTEEDMNNQIFEKFGLQTTIKREVILKSCPRCTNILKPGDRFCSRCSLCLDHSAFNSIEAGENITMDVLSVLEKYGLWDEINRLKQKGESGPKKTNDKKDLSQNKD